MLKSSYQNLVKWAQQKSNFPVLVRFLFSLGCGCRVTYKVQCSTPVCLSFWLGSWWVLGFHSQAFPQELLNSWLLARCSSFPLSSPAHWLASIAAGLSWLSSLSICSLSFTSALYCMKFFNCWVDRSLIPKTSSWFHFPKWWLIIVIHFSSSSACPLTGSSQRTVKWVYWVRDAWFSAGPVQICGSNNICSKTSQALKILGIE